MEFLHTKNLRNKALGENAATSLNPSLDACNFYITLIWQIDQELERKICWFMSY